jgi:2'-5' RNA ligase
MKEEIKRLFFGFEVLSPWPTEFPEGRILDASCRHMTIAFLGQTHYEKLLELLTSFPRPPFKVGQVGHFDRSLFLPERHPRVVAWHMKFLNPKNEFESYYKKIVQWIKECNFRVDERDHFLPHLTIGRAPFEIKSWKNFFAKLPFMTSNLHLYESLGNLEYHSCWEYPLRLPFEELDHIADIAFRIRGDSLQDLFRNAFTALAFKFPPLLTYSGMVKEINEFDDIVAYLNDIVGQADGEKGCPFKAVSYHGNLNKEDDQTLVWEMIVDV